MGVITITNENFSKIVLGAKLPVLVDFWATWCMPCKAVAPIVEEIANDLSGDLIVAKLNVDECEMLAQKYEVMSIPTLMVFKNGTVVDKMIGMRSKSQYIDMLKKHM